MNSKAEAIINESNLDDVFESIYITIVSNMQKSLRKDSGWITDSGIDYIINISKYNPLSGRSYIKLAKELNQPRKSLINIQSVYDHECFKWCLVRYLHPTDHNPRRITKANKDFKDIEFPVRIRDIHKIEKKNSICISVFGYEDKKKYPIYVSKNVVEINVSICY